MPASSIADPIAAASSVTLAAALAIGVGAQTGLIDTVRVRWIHHALFATATTACVATAGVAVARRDQTTPWALATVGALAVLPRTRGGSIQHGAVAGIAALCQFAGRHRLPGRRTVGCAWT